MPVDFLTDEQYKSYENIPATLTQDQLDKYFYLDDKDKELGRVDNSSPRLRASACPRHPGDAQVKNKAKLRALIH